MRTLVFCSSKERMLIERTIMGEKVEVNGQILNGRCKGKYQVPTIDERIFPNTPSGSFWTNASYGAYKNFYWFVFFNNGGDDGECCYKGYIRLDRN